jgi:hypothetical protein
MGIETETVNLISRSQNWNQMMMKVMTMNYGNLQNLNCYYWT